MLLAKQAASLDALSGGRLTLGVALGARPDDYDAAGVDQGGRGAAPVGEQLAELREIWEGARSAPTRSSRAARRCWSVGGGARRSCGSPATPTATSTAAARRGRSPAPPTRPGRPGGTGAAGPAPAVGPGLLRPRRRRRRRRLPARLLRLHRPVRRAGRGRPPDQRPRRQGLRPRVRRGRLRRAGPAAHRRRPGRARPAGRRARLTWRPAMRIGVCGGGPAGLYLAHPAGQAGRRHEVTVRRAQPARRHLRLGRRVLGRDAGRRCATPTTRATWRSTDTFARWSAIDVRLRRADRSARAATVLGHRPQAAAGDPPAPLPRGRGRAGLPAEAPRPGPVRRLRPGGRRRRGQLDRPAAAGRAPAPDPGPPPAPSTSGSAPTCALDVFTFIFRATEHGLFQVHAYPFDADTSTFIVECTEATWRAAGLDQDERGREHRLLPGPVRPRARRAPAALQPVAVDQLRHRPQPELAPRQRRAARRRRPHRPLHDRVGHQAGHGGRGRPGQGPRSATRPPWRRPSPTTSWSASRWSSGSRRRPPTAPASSRTSAATTASTRSSSPSTS